MRIGCFRENPTNLGHCIANGGSQRDVFLPNNLSTASKDKGCFVPRWTNLSKVKGHGCQVTEMGAFPVLAASCPGKPDSQVGHLSGMDCGRAHQGGQPESSGPEQFPCQLVQVASAPSTLCWMLFLCEWVSFNIYNVLWLLGFKNNNINNNNKKPPHLLTVYWSFS